MLLILVFEVILPYSFQVDVPGPGGMTSVPSDLNPDFTGPIHNVTVAVGREAVLSCTVTDLGHYKVGWMKADDQTILSLHTRVITHNPRISVTHDDNLRTWHLRIRQLKETDGGCYMCQINTSSMKKTTGCVDVQVPPDIDDDETSGDLTVGEGENVTLACKAKGHPPPRILWRREDGAHILFHPKAYDSDIDTYSGSSLSLARLNRRQMGAYLCIASNDVPPAVSKRITLNINFAPGVQVYKPLVGAPLGSVAKLKCEVESFPSSNNYWIKDHNENLINSSKHTVHEKKIGIKLTMILIVHNVSESDYGTYKCYASNIIGKSDSAIRLYEIKMPTTTTTSTTTTTTSTTPVAYYEPTSIQNVIFSPATVRVDTMHGLDEDPSENWLFPSVAPAPLELETMSATGATMAVAGYKVAMLCNVMLFVYR